MKAKKLPTLKYLEECFCLDDSCLSGLRWKERPKHHFKTEHGFNVFNTKYANKQAGSMDEDGYFFVRISGQSKPYQTVVHRIVYALYNKEVNIEDFFIDHIDRNPSNNSPDNLRLVSHAENMMNSRPNKNSKSGVRGVYPIKNRWFSHIHIDGKRYALGAYNSIEDAVLARKQAEEKTLTFYFKGLSKKELLEKTIEPDLYTRNKDGTPNKNWFK